MLTDKEYKTYCSNWRQRIFSCRSWVSVGRGASTRWGHATIHLLLHVPRYAVITIIYVQSNENQDSGEKFRPSYESDRNFVNKHRNCAKSVRPSYRTRSFHAILLLRHDTAWIPFTRDTKHEAERIYQCSPLRIVLAFTVFMRNEKQRSTEFNYRSVRALDGLGCRKEARICCTDCYR